jgi:uncharacterized protein YbaR (Trm112 family)
MSVDPELLEILRCPESGGELEPVELPEPVQRMLVEKYREHFRDEEPVADSGLWCRLSHLVYPVVSEIPLLLKDEALPESILAGAEPPAATAV